MVVETIRCRILTVLIGVILLLCPVAAWAGTSPIVVLDPGHGGDDPGAVDQLNGILEKTINLEVARRVQHKLEARGYKVLLTRDQDDVFCHAPSGGFVKRQISLEERIELANGNAADIFISIHANSFHDRTCTGAEIFYHRLSQDGRELAEEFQGVLNGLPETVECKLKASNYYVLRSTTMPAVLVEMGYITNDCEGKLLLESTYQEKLAEAFAEAVNRYFKKVKDRRTGLSESAPSTATNAKAS